MLLKESYATIYHLLGTGKLLRKLFPRKLYALRSNDFYEISIVGPPSPPILKVGEGGWVFKVLLNSEMSDLSYKKRGFVKIGGELF